MNKFKNISLRVFREYLIFCGLNHIRTKGGHEVWSAKGLSRPVVLQTHVDPVPEFIIKNNLRTMGKTANHFLDFLNL
jgi:hypothetical protein